MWEMFLAVNAKSLTVVLKKNTGIEIMVLLQNSVPLIPVLVDYLSDFSLTSLFLCI